MIALVSSTTRAAEVAERVAPEVIRQVVQDSRAQRATNARNVLGAANRVLAAQGRPMVADPGPTANAEQILAAASSAQVLSVLPDDIAEQILGRAPGQVLVLPSADTPSSSSPRTGQPGAAPAPDQPGATGPGSSEESPSVADPPPAGTSVPPTAGQTSPPRATVPAQPGPRTSERRLLPPLLPFDFPLIGT